MTEVLPGRRVRFGRVAPRLRRRQARHCGELWLGQRPAGIHRLRFSAVAVALRARRLFPFLHVRPFPPGLSLGYYGLCWLTRVRPGFAARVADSVGVSSRPSRVRALSFLPSTRLITPDSLRQLGLRPGGRLIQLSCLYEVHGPGRKFAAGFLRTPRHPGDALALSYGHCLTVQDFYLIDNAHAGHAISRRGRLAPVLSTVRHRSVYGGSRIDRSVAVAGFVWSATPAGAVAWPLPSGLHRLRFFCCLCLPCELTGCSPFFMFGPSLGFYPSGTMASADSCRFSRALLPGLPTRVGVSLSLPG